MVSRKSRNIYISKYFMAVRNCINNLVIYLIRSTSLLTCSYIGKLLSAGNLHARLNPSSYFKRIPF